MSKLLSFGYAEEDKPTANTYLSSEWHRAFNINHALSQPYIMQTNVTSIKKGNEAGVLTSRDLKNGRSIYHHCEEGRIIHCSTVRKYCKWADND